jgi:hypothetical protein
MKKLLIALILCFTLLSLSSIGACEVWYTANQKTFSWEAVTKLEDGSPIPSGSTIKYQPYIKLSTATEGTAYQGEITELSKTITFTVEGAYYLGVKTIRYVGTEKVSESAISWSNDPLVCFGGVPFGVNYYQSPKKPMNLKGE